MNKKLFASVVLVLTAGFAVNDAAARGFSGGGFRAAPTIRIAPMIMKPSAPVHVAPTVVETAKVAPSKPATPAPTVKAGNDGGNKPPKPPVAEKSPSNPDEKPGRPMVTTGPATPGTTAVTQNPSTNWWFWYWMLGNNHSNTQNHATATNDCNDSQKLKTMSEQQRQACKNNDWK